MQLFYLNVSSINHVITLPNDHKATLLKDFMLNPLNEKGSAKLIGSILALGYRGLWVKSGWGEIFSSYIFEFVSHDCRIP